VVAGGGCRPVLSSGTLPRPCLCPPVCRFDPKLGLFRSWGADLDSSEFKVGGVQAAAVWGQEVHWPMLSTAVAAAACMCTRPSRERWSTSYAADVSK
jgi:hypothetical protein